MMKTIAGVAAAAAIMLAGALPAAALPLSGPVAAKAVAAPVVAVSYEHEWHGRPYWMDFVYDEQLGRYFPRMRYDRGYQPSHDRYGYWYGDGYDGDYVLERRKHRHHSRSRHVSWCRAHYRTYDAGSDTFVGKGMRKYTCNSPYDGRS